jgi:hypothetical protein
VRREVFTALAGVELILHAGDVGDDVLIEIQSIAPVYAVYGNTDAPGGSLPAARDLDLDGVAVHVSHGHELGSPTPGKLLASYNADVIVYGHTHKPLVERVGRRLVVNPGAAGPRRFDSKPSVARLKILNNHADADIVWL